jgi:hypothetical protein
MIRNRMGRLRRELEQVRRTRGCIASGASARPGR